MKRGLLICLVCALSWFFVFDGIDWGVPSSGRMALAMDEGLKNEDFYDSLVKARNLVYKDTKSAVFASPSYRNDEFKAKDRIVVDYAKDGVTFYFSNYLRHYFLCSHNPDENAVFNGLSNMNPSKLDFNPHFFFYGGGYIYPLAAWYKALSWVKAVKLVPDMRHYFRNPDDMGGLYTSGRALSALMGTLGILMLVLFEYKLIGTLFWPAILALLCFTSPMIVLWSKILKPHFYLLPFSTMCIMASYRFFDTKNARYFRGAMFLCGVVAGIALTTSILTLFPLMAYLRNSLEARPEMKVAAKDLAAGTLLFGTGLLMLNPYYVLSPQELLAEMKYVSSTLHVSGGMTSIYNFFRYGLGILPSVLFIAAACIGVYYRKITGAFNFMLLLLILLVSPMVYRLPNLPADIRWATFILPLSFFYTVEILRQKKKPQAWLRALVLACALVSVADAFRFRTYCVNDSRAATSTRLQAGEWINDNTGTASIGHLYDIIPWTFPPVKFTKHRMIVYGSLEELFRDADKPQYFVYSDVQRYARTKEQEKRFYELYRLEKGFHNTREPLELSSTLTPANEPIYVLKRI
ncbi:MAG: hypothetical protein HY796_02400 [Elusimicrobia bacterium]|nr:hypothetical protein [Elusimicrobiota bacterium]